MPASERALIASFRRQASVGRGVLKGIGDDCAILRVPPGHETLVTTDFSLEGRHFRRDWHSPEFIGHRCLTRGLSDIAAMGGVPIAAFLSLALPPKLPQAWTNRFMKGLLSLASRHHVTLAGGDTAQSPSGVLADIIVLGSVPRGKADPALRSKTGRCDLCNRVSGSFSRVVERAVARPRAGPHAAITVPPAKAADGAVPAAKKSGHIHDRPKRRPLHRPLPYLRRKQSRSRALARRYPPRHHKKIKNIPGSCSARRRRLRTPVHRPRTKGHPRQIAGVTSRKK